MSEFDRLVGIPYVDGGRDFTGCDCWGLLRLGYRELLGINLPSLQERYSLPADRKAIAALIESELDPWCEMRRGEERSFDALLMREGGQPRHIGLIVEPGIVLHVERGQTSRIERYRTGVLSHRVIGIYRYRDHE